MNKKIKSAGNQMLLWMIVVILLLLLIIYISIAMLFQNRFGFRTTVNGVNASGKSPEQVEQLIREEVERYELTLEERENRTEILRGSTVGVKVELDGSLVQELEKQNGFAWPLYLLCPTRIEVGAQVTYDKTLLEEELKRLACMDEEQMKKPENATISEYSEENGYEILAEKEGTVIDYEKLLIAVEKSLTNLQKSVSLEAEGCYTEAERRSDSEELKALLDILNYYAGAKITYVFGNRTEILDGKIISQWLTVNDDMEVEISEEKAAEYIAELADAYDTAGEPKSLRTSYGTTVTVSGGDYGWEIDRETETEALMKHIEAGDRVSKEPAYSKTANSHGENDYGNTYAEVNLTAQHMFFYKDGELVIESDLVSGNEARGWSTPTGVYSLYNKQKNRTLRGPGYASRVSFWMPFNRGVGFHDATWRKAFGKNYYKRSGSHGCVNLPYDAAKTLYENIEVGCPVFVYTLPGTESEE